MADTSMVPAAADEEWRSFKATAHPQNAEPAAPVSPAERLLRASRQRQKVADAALAFWNRHRTDPRRWEAADYYLGRHRGFAKEGDHESEYQGIKGLALDEDAWNAYFAKGMEIAAAVLASPDSPDKVRVAAELFLLRSQHHAALASRVQAGQPVDFRYYLSMIESIGARYPEHPHLGIIAINWMGIAKAAGIKDEDLQAALHRLATNPNTSLRTYVERQLAVMEHDARLRTRPLELAFTAADGREVDLAKLRGKVVLVDFWATWCGPCIAELPNLKRVYAEYHEKGFEIVGIALENAGLRPDDTPAQTETKLARSRQVLADFTAREAMPWPQYFDGKFWKNDISTKYTISSIPAMFLLDQSGRLVTTDARGEKLEQEVKRLLKL